MPLVRVSPQDVLTLRDVCDGIHIFGGLGSGKTSGSGQTLANAYLRSGFGGLVLTAKTSETAVWRRYAKRCGRSQSLVLIGPDHPWRFNFLDYEMRRPGRGEGDTSNLVSLLEEVLEVHNPNKVLGGDPYWRQARGQLLRNSIDLVKLGRGKIQFDDVAGVVRSAPKRPSDQQDPTWRASSLCARLMRDALARAEATGSQRELSDLRNVTQYFFDEFAPMDPEPRSSVVSMVGALTDILTRGDVRELLLGKTNIVPDLAKTGTVFVLDMPVHEYRESGQFVQTLFKTVFQRMAERRPERGETARPLFLWADEAHLFSTTHDPTFQTTARESRVATVYLSQNLPNYYDAFGGDAAGQTRAKKLLGAFGIKMFHANGDPETNNYAEDLFGKILVWRESYSANESTTVATDGRSNTDGSGRNISQVLESVLHARVLTMALRGGAGRGWTEAYAFRAGEPWTATQSSGLYIRFPQVPLDARGCPC